MGFPVGYPQVVPSKLLLPLLSLLTLLKTLTVTLLGFLGLSDTDCLFFLDGTATTWPESHALSLHHGNHHQYHRHSGDDCVLPVVRFSSLLLAGDIGRSELPESCTVCLYEFEGDDEIMLPMNCRHVFHRSCLRRWIGYNHRRCPLCRAPLLTLVDDDDNIGGDDVMWLNRL